MIFLSAGGKIVGLLEGLETDVCFVYFCWRR